MQKILIVEDEQTISRILSVYLKKAGYSIEQAFTGQEAFDKFDEQTFQLVLLDVMLPDYDGWHILKEIRAKSATPVIMLTALSDVQYRLSGLNGGADDYISKPFVADEVVARAQAVLRRSVGTLNSEDSQYFGNLKLDFKSHTVTLNGVSVELTRRDLSLLFFLAQHPNQTFTRDQLIDQVWGIDYEGSDRAVDLSVKRLRRALENWNTDEGEIKTLRGLGYQFCVYTTS
ncbi:response regulator transcription factor [Priestia filamentosa]|uniref:response regulator transcription factor n=1 Tax=Priestia filamentosa TaxID=1402861 RepID=UPI001FB1EFD8|nr:response regulator transcription factor [Priestia filamentosa]MED3728884.1 response regulator transcription factor [Priestia filamentosa]UOE62345.1 response regulator transcription factor [Priestia filamentosa]